jgi:hypothetical protein
VILQRSGASSAKERWRPCKIAGTKFRIAGPERLVKVLKQMFLGGTCIADVPRAYAHVLRGHMQMFQGLMHMFSVLLPKEKTLKQMFLGACVIVLTFIAKRSNPLTDLVFFFTKKNDFVSISARRMLAASFAEHRAKKTATRS